MALAALADEIERAAAGVVPLCRERAALDQQRGHGGVAPVRRAVQRGVAW